MAEAPTIRTQADFLNHIRRVLDSGLQRWEFAEPSGSIEDVPFVCPIRFANGHEVTIVYGTAWLAYGKNWQLADRLTGLLNGLVRDSTGQMVQP